MTYPKTGPDVPPSPRFPAIEREVIDFWKADDTFRASIENREGAPEWVFYDGPPFANGLPHYGHLLTGYAKDLFPRFQTMRGNRVDRVFGWDTHGLPAELEAMKQLGITEKEEIERMGVATFNSKARESVLAYTREWEDYVTRQARWVDFERGYKTLDTDYMESVLWAFKTLYDKGLAYEGYRVLPYCWRDQTPLSTHELRMDDDVYKMRQDPSVTVTFPLVGVKAEALGLTAVRALAWTTTPWTLSDQPRTGRRPRHPLRRRPGRSAGRRRRASRPRRPQRRVRRGGIAPLPARRRPAAELREGPRLRRPRGCRGSGAGRPPGRRSRGRALRPPLRLLRRRRDVGHAERLAHPRRRLRDDRRRHRHRPPGPGVR